MKKILMLLFLFRSLVKLKSIVYDCDDLNKLVNYYSFEINGFNSFSEIIIQCSTYFKNINLIEITPNRALILDKSFNLNGLHLYLDSIHYYFSYLKGINLNLDLIGSLPTYYVVPRNELYVTMIGLTLDFYLTYSKRLENEDECNSYRLQQPNFFTNLSRLELDQVVYSSELCPMLFMSSKIDSLHLNSISNSFINKNRLFLCLLMNPTQNY